MKLKTIIVLIFFLSFSSTFAVKRWGEITKKVHYDRLNIEQLSASRCKLTIQIENKSKKFISRFGFRITAFDIHKSVEWQTAVGGRAIQAGDEKTISTIIHNCTEDNPYKLVFSFK